MTLFKKHDIMGIQPERGLGNEGSETIRRKKGSSPDQNRIFSADPGEPLCEQLYSADGLRPERRFFCAGVNYVAPAFSYASRVNEALRQGIEFVSRDDALAAWQQAWLSVFLCLFCLGIMVFCVMVGIKMIKIILEFQRRGRTL